MMGETECLILKVLCGAMTEGGKHGCVGPGPAEDAAYLGFALSSELRRHGGGV